MKNKDNNFFLPLILALALSLRLMGITHGFPFILHPDEPTVIRTALSLRFYPNPGHFDWPHLFIYINYFAYLFFGQFRRLMELLDLKELIVTFLPVFWNDKLIFYLITRCIAAFLGALTVVPVYLTARDNLGKRVGIIAALTFAVIPFHVWHSHYSLIDVPMLFFAAWGVFFMTWIIRRRDPNDYSGAGFYIGLASSTKYNAALNAFILPIAHLFRIITSKEHLLDKKAFGYLILSAFTFAIGFLMGTPYALLDYQTFLRTDGPKGALWQFTNVGSVDLVERPGRFVSEMLYRISDDTGYTVLIGFFLTGVLLIYRALRKVHKVEDPVLLFLFTSGLFLLLYVSGVKHNRSHYYFIAYPYLVVCFSYILDLVLQKLRPNNALIGFFIFFAGLGLPTFMAARNVFTFSRSDTRVALYYWLRTTVDKDDVLYYNNSSLALLVDAFDNRHVKLKPNVNLDRSGLLLVSQDSEESSPGVNMAIYGSRLKRIATVENYLRLGPRIEIYSVNQ
jgi:4-amino-4-deoxy-L-arabinose transferase-like glycosyltransferase